MLAHRTISAFFGANIGEINSARSRNTHQSPAVPASRLISLASALMVCCCVLVMGIPVGAQQNNTINTVAGGGAMPSVPTQADLAGASSVAEDSSGNVYIALPSSYYIVEWNRGSNTLSIFAGTGLQGGGGDGGPASSATLIGPAALTFDPAENLYIADANKIRCVAAVNGACGGVSAGQINTIAGTREACEKHTDSCGDGGPASKAQLDLPQGLATDSAGNIYIIDTGDYRLRCIAAVTGACGGVSAGYISTLAGTGLACQGGTGQICGDGGPATQATLNQPRGVIVDGSANIYIADSRDQRIRCVAAVNGACGGVSVGDINTVAGNGKECANSQGSCGDGGLPTQAQLHTPGGLSLDGSGNLYIADTLNQKIRMVTFGSTPSISTIAGSGVQGFSGDQGSATKAALDDPLDVIVDSSANVTIADSGNQRIRQVASGMIQTVSGGGSGGDGGSPLSATLANDVTIAWDGAGSNFYIADAANNRIRKVSPGSSGVITSVAGTGSLGYSGDDGPALQATLNSPTGVAADSAGDIFIADVGNFVIRKVDKSGVITTVAGNGMPCIPRTGKCGDGGLAKNANLNSPTSVAVDGKGNFYIADWIGCRVRKVNSSGIISTLAGNGQCGFAGDGGAGAKAKVNYPYGVAADAVGNVYISDSENNRIRCVVGAAGGCGGSKAQVGTIITYAFNGQRGFGGDGGNALKASMQLPLEVALDPSRNLFVGGGVDDVVRRIDAATQTVDTVAGNPSNPTQAGFAGDGAPSRLAVMQNVGLAVNAGQQLLIADTGNNRVRQVDMVPAVKRLTRAVNFGNETVGHTSAPMPAKLGNTGLASLPISSQKIVGKDAGDFAISSKTCGDQLAPGLTCEVEITFTPKAKGPRTANLETTDSVGKQEVQLTGTGQ
jgi:sugar lactone lactonase YvrE